MSDTGVSVRVLGVTGGIASGKSTAARVFGELGATVVSADDLAREAVAPGTRALEEVVSAFGAEILKDGCLDREALGRLVFANEKSRRRLEDILHPAIRNLAEQRLAELRNKDIPLVIYEAPLLFEAGAEDRVDAVLAITVDAQIQLQRIVQRDGVSPEEAEARVAAQMPQSEKASRSDFVIANNGSEEDLRAAVTSLYRKLTD